MLLPRREHDVPSAPGAVRVFVSYAHDDRGWCDRLLRHLGALRETGRIHLFDDSQIEPGEWERQLRIELDHADVIVLIVTASFGNSRFCTSVELAQALGRFERDGTRVIPILAEHCDWQALPIARFQILPQDTHRNLTPLSDWLDANKPLSHIAQTIRTVVEQIERERGPGVTRRVGEPHGPHAEASLSSAHLDPPERGSVNESELLNRAKALIPRDWFEWFGGGYSATLGVIVVGGPKRPIIRPAKLESQKLLDLIMQTATFSGHRVFDSARGWKREIKDDALHIHQERYASVLLTPLGDVRILRRAQSKQEGYRHGLPALIEEDVRELITHLLQFAAWLLDHVDANRRLQTVAPLVTVLGAEGSGWKTRREHAADPNRMTMKSYYSDSPIATMLTPALRPRAALALQAHTMAEDLTVLLRRKLRG